MLKSTGSIEAVVDEVNSTGDKLLVSVGRPFRVQGEEIFMSTSIGVALYPRDGQNVVDLLRNADAALYQAKRAGGNCIDAAIATNAMLGLTEPQMNGIGGDLFAIQGRDRSGLNEAREVGGP